MTHYYEVLSYKTIDELIEAVNRYIAEGWVPTGGICVTQIANVPVFMQAMTNL